MSKLILLGSSPSTTDAISSNLKDAGVETTALPVGDSSWEEKLGGDSDQRFLLVCSSQSDSALQPLIETCHKKGIHYLDFNDSRSAIESALSSNGNSTKSLLVPALATHLVPFASLAKHLMSKMIIGSKITLGARERLSFADATQERTDDKPLHERKISFRGDVHSCLPRHSGDRTTPLIKEAIKLKALEIFDPMDREEKDEDNEVGHYWGMIEEDKGLFKIRNLETPSATKRGIELASAIIKKIVAKDTGEQSGLVFPYDLVGFEWLEKHPETKVIGDTIRLAGLQAKRAD